MKKLSLARLPVRSRVEQRGSTLLVALFTVAVLSMVAGCVLASISSRYNSAFRSAAWHDAMLAAETGIDTAVADIAGLLPDVRATTDGIGTGYTQDADPLGLVQQVQVSGNGLLKRDPNNPLLTLKTVELVHGGEGGTTQRAEVSLEIITLDQILSEGSNGGLNLLNGVTNGGSVNLLRLRSKGTASLSGGTVAGPSRLDNELWRPSLLTDRFTGARITTPSVSRQVEVIMRPVYPFESAVSSNDALLAKDKVLFDSFNSALTAASTNGEYDSTKRLNNGTVLANGSNVTIGGAVYGDVGTGGGNVPASVSVTGTVNNASYAPLPPLQTPLMAAAVYVPLVFGTFTVPAGLNAAPAKYNLSGINGFSKLRITNGGSPLNTDVVVYVNGDITGSIEVDPGVTAKVYVTGSINTSASKLQNDSRRAANLQIYGVPASNSSQTIRINNDANFIAAIYAPLHGVYMNGNSDVSGAVVAGRFEMTGKMRVHYDESLAFNVGPPVRYRLVNWREIVE